MGRLRSSIFQICLVGQISEPVLSDNGRAIAFEYRPVDGAVQIGHLVESDAKTWRLSGLFTGQGQSLFKPGVSSDGRTVVCYAERATGGFEFAWILPEESEGDAAVHRTTVQGTAMPTIALSINSEAGAVLVPVRADSPQKKGLGIFDLAKREWTSQAHRLPIPSN